MAAFIDVEIVIDTVTLLEKFPAPSTDYKNPTGIDHTSFSYMIAAKDFVESGMATGDLVLKAINGDVIRWRSLSLAGNSDHTAVLYEIGWFKGDHVTDKYDAHVGHPYVPIPIIADGKNTTPPSFESKIEDDYYINATITNRGTENYHVKFYVTVPDRTTGKPKLKGYFYWDPVIKVP